MTRREFITLLGGSMVVWPYMARAQQSGHVPLIVFWLGGMPSDPEVQASASAFRDTLRELGWIDGRNIRVARRSYPASFTPEDMNVAAGEITALDPDVIASTRWKFSIDPAGPTCSVVVRSFGRYLTFVGCSDGSSRSCTRVF